MSSDKCFAFLRTVTCKKGSSATHLNMKGGVYNISEEQNKNFLHAYSTYLDHNKYQANTFQHLTEVVSPKFPYFIDLDILDPCDKCADEAAEGGDGAEDMELALQRDNLNAPPGINTIHRWTHAITSALSECVTSTPDTGDILDTDDMCEEDDYYCPPTFGGCEITFNGINVIGERDRLSPMDCVVATAPVRMVTKSGVTYKKTGVHIVWPSLIVNKELANVLRAIVIAALYEFDKAERKRDRSHYCRDWTSVVDEAVYRNMSSLRMVGSYKICKCNDCATDEMKKRYFEKEALTNEFQCMVSIENPRITNSRFVKVEAAVNHARTILQTRKSNRVWASKDLLARCERFIQLHEMLRCDCNGRLKKTDRSAGVYSVKMALTADGSRNTHFEDVMRADTLIMVYAVSVRRPDSTPLTPITLPPHAPIAYPVRFEEVDKGEDERAVKAVQRGHPLPQNPSSKRHIFEVIEDKVTQDKVENYLRSGCLGAAYERIQVRKMMKHWVYPQRKCAELDQNQDGTHSYSVQVIVEGYGSSFCHAVNRDHTSNTIYFEFTPDRRCMQMCRSTKSQNCKKCVKDVQNVDYRVYVPLFKHTTRTINVLPEEERDWFNRSLSRNYLRLEIDDAADMIPRAGPTFKAVLSLARTKSARLKKPVSSSMRQMDEGSSNGESEGEKKAPGMKRKRTDGGGPGRRLSSSASMNSIDDMVDATF